MSKNPTILYVDDEEPNLLLFKAFFDRHFNILTARSGQEALAVLDLCRELEIVVISDLRMPEMDGIQFIRKAKENHHHIPYYILTGCNCTEEIESAVKENIIKTYFTKPINSKEIIAAIEQISNR